MIAPLFLALLQAPVSQDKPYTPHVEPASDEGVRAIAGFKTPPGIEVELWAAEPLLANPVAIFPADTGEVYVCETFRLHRGVTDIREHMDWLDDDNASKSIEDLVAMFKKHLGPEGFADICKERERVRVLRDLDGDGKADKATVFDDRFGDPADGIAAGVLKWGKDVYLTNMPHLWHLRDDDGDDQADVHESLSYGYGVHVQFLGHDLHGLAVGPDGYLYFSCGDRGFQVKTREGTVLDHTHAGAVLRCELDGSHLEIVHSGLRNPQELAFNAEGDLFTGDNNGDGGDKAKWIQIVMGADSGWRNGWQWVNDPTPRGFFNEEGLWKPHFDGQAAYLLPPIANITDGPSGLCYNPSTKCLAEKYNGHFFLCDFRGEASGSQIWSFALKQKGAGFEVTDYKTFVKGTLVTDCDFGPDGALYFSDWVSGWGQTGKGRIYRAFDGMYGSLHGGDVRTLLAQGMAKRPLEELEGLLDHDDMRIRLRAELELAKRGMPGFEKLLHAAKRGRVQGLWGMGVAARWDRSIDVKALFPPLNYLTGEWSAQAARVAGDLHLTSAVGELITLLGDKNARVQMQAAIALAKIGDARAVGPLLTLATETGSKDPTLRSAVCFALAQCAKAEDLIELQHDVPSTERRLAIVVALRRQKDPLVGRFLDDPDPLVRAEAARAVYDTPIVGPSAETPLSTLMLWHPLDAQQILRRSTHAAWRIGGEFFAFMLAKFALRTDADEYARKEALELLGKWKQPHARDPLLGEWRPLEERDDSFMPKIVLSLAEEQVAFAPESVLKAWIDLAGQYKCAEVAGLVKDIALDAKRAPKLRVAALRALDKIAPADFEDTLKLALADAQDAVRGAALPILVRRSPAAALPFLTSATKGNREERRAAYRTLADMKGDAVDELLGSELAGLTAGLVPGEVQLELVEACEKRAQLKPRLEAWRKPREQDPKLAPWLDALLGGDTAKGREIFRTKTELSCLRCHRIGDNEDGGQVGPNLGGIGKRLTRLELVEALVDPNRKIATGFNNTIVFLNEGAPIEGVVFEDNAQELKLRDKDDKVHVVAKADIETVKPGLSAMPTDLAKHLSRTEVRDLVEFLSRQ